MTLDNESALEELAWAIEASQGQFALFLARCNYASLQRQLSQRLQQICKVPIRTLELKREDKTLYARIQAELGTEQPNSVMVFGWEMVRDLQHLLTSTNQVREEFQKNFQFPLVLWVNDEILKQLTRIAPDFESWATTVAFLMPPQDLANLIRETAEQWFTNNLVFTLEDCLALEVELEAAQKDLLDYEQADSRELEAERQSLLGFVKRVNQQVDVAIEHYKTGLAFWRENQNLERQAKLLDEIAFCYYLKKPDYQNRDRDVSQESKDYVREYLQVIEQIQRPDLLANSILRFGEALGYVQDWEQFQRLVRQALQLHEADNKPVELARDYGFLAEAALAQSRWDDANQFARKALEILSANHIFENIESTDLVKQHDASLYRFILAKAQQSLGQLAEAIQNLVAAKEVGSPEYDPQLFIDILFYLQRLYFDVKDYLKAFKIKLERQSVEQRYGLRAFIGAGRIKSQRYAKLAQKQVVQTHVLDSLQENIAPEITASGRMLDVERLRRRVGENSYKLIVIHGQSGVGKSSLVYGGLVPALKQKAIGFQDVLPVTMRVYTNWVGELGKLLAEALAEKGVEIIHELSVQNTADILEELRKNESRNLRTVLIFDQFEEFFFVYANPVERREFFAFLGECLNILPLKVILSLREDYLHYLLEMDSLDSMKIIGNDILAKNVRYKLGNFSADDAKSIIERLTEASSFKLDSDLIGQLVEDLARELGEVRPIELQVVGAQLQTENITTLAEYQDCGRQAKEELVKRYLAEVVDDCGGENKQAAELVLFLLTDEKGTRPLKTRAELERDLQALVADLSAEGRGLDLVLEVFVGSGLVLLLPEKPDDRYQLVHDYLAAFIRQQQGQGLVQELVELRKQQEQSQAEIERLRTEMLQVELAREQEQRKLVEEELARAEKTKKILQAANRRSQQLIQRGSAFLVISVIVAAVIAVLAGLVYQKLREAQTGTRLEREGMAGLQQFEFREMEALVSAMRTGQELKSLVKNRPLEEYPTASPLLALETILDNIREESQLKGHQNPVNSANFSPKGDRIVTTSFDNTAKVWDLSGKLIAELKHQSRVISANFSPKGDRIVTTSDDNTAKVWDLSGKLIAELKHQNPVISANFSPKGDRIVTTASWDNTAKVWDLSGKLIAELKHQNPVISANFSPKGDRIVTTSDDNTAKVWDLSGKLIAELKHQSRVISANFSPKGDRIVTASDDNTAKVWDLSGKLIAELKHQSRVISANFSPKGDRIVTTSFDNTAKVWDLSGKLIAELKHQNPVISANFSPKGDRIVTTASWDNTAKVWDLSGKLIAELKHQSSVNSANFSNKGDRIVTASLDNTARVWDLSGKLIAELKGHQSFVWSANFSPKGDRIVTASADNTAKVWDLSGKLIAELKHQSSVSSANFSPKGDRIVTASLDNTARVWDLSGKQLAEFKGDGNSVYDANFSPDGKRIIVASGNSAKVWDVENVGNLDLLLARGCKWLNYYLVVNPKELQTLKVCQNESNKLAAAEVMVKDGEEEARNGNIDAAVATFNQAFEWNASLKKFNPKTKAQDLKEATNLVKDGVKLARDGNIKDAVAAFQRALPLDSSLDFQPEEKARKTLASGLIEKGSSFVEQRKFKDAMTTYNQAEKLVSKQISAYYWYDLCKQGTLQGHAADVKFACEKLPLFDRYRHRWMRGINRALTGNKKGAIEDLEAVVASIKDKKDRAKVQGWIDGLRAGKNPFTDEEIKRLRG